MDSSSSDSELEGFTVALIKGLMIERAAELRGAASDAQAMEGVNEINAAENVTEDEEDFEDSEGEDEYEEDQEDEEEWVEVESGSEGPCTEEEYREELLFALTNAERSGSFCAEGTLKMFNPPGLEVARLGPIGLPLTATQAKELAKVCSQAPFGRREATVYDTSVRRCLQLSPDQFRLQGPDWAAQLQRLVNTEIKRGLGVPENLKVVPQLYKLLLYEPGSFFTQHRDSEKEDGMFGTLSVVLPSAHKGGELIVRHAGREDVLDFASRCMYHVHWAAFYADREHEILPVKSGHRLVLVYNLVAQGPVGELEPADNRQAVKDALAALRAWSADEDGPFKLVIPLEHQYSSRSLSFNGLKGPDIATVDILCQAAKIADRPPFHFFLGMLKMSESGPEDYDDDDWDTTLELTDIIAPSGETVRYSKLECDEDELLPEGALDDHDWDHERSNDTGNEGVTVERWYRHAALIVWPHSKHWEVACTSNIGKAIKEASELAATAKQVRETLEATLGDNGRLSRGEAGLVTELVFEHGQVHVLAELRRALQTICKYGGKLTPAQAQTLTKLLLKHGDVDMARTLVIHCPSPADGLVVPALASRFSWAVLQPDILALLTRKCDTASLTDCLKLLLRIAPKPPESDAPPPQAGASGEASGYEPSASEGESTVEAGGVKTEERRERAVEGRGSRPAAIVQFGLGVGTSGRALLEPAAGARDGVSQVLGGTAQVEGNGRSASTAEPSGNVTGTAEPAEFVPPRKPTKDEQAREELCRSAIAIVVDKVVTKASGTNNFYPGYFPNCSLNSQSMPPFVRLIERFGTEPFAPATDALVRNKVESSLQTAAELLWDFVRVGHAKRPKGSPPDLSPPALAFCRQFAAELASKLIKEADPPPENRLYQVAYVTPPRSSEFVALFLKTLHSLQVDQEVMDPVVAHLLATPNAHPIDRCLLHALKELVAWFGEGPMNVQWFAELLGGCLGTLESACAEPPPEPRNWALPATWGCVCECCPTLLDFCHDPERTKWTYPKTSDHTRNHLRQIIERNGLPVKAVAKEPVSEMSPLLLIKEGSEGKSHEAELAVLATRIEKYEKDKNVLAELSALRLQVQGEAKSKDDQTIHRA